MRIFFFVAASLMACVVAAEQPTPLASSLLFHASFDRSANADVARDQQTKQQIMLFMLFPAINLTCRSGL